jgi:hypothetical protein
VRQCARGSDFSNYGDATSLQHVAQFAAKSRYSRSCLLFLDSFQLRAKSEDFVQF